MTWFRERSGQRSRAAHGGSHIALSVKSPVCPCPAGVGGHQQRRRSRQSNFEEAYSLHNALAVLPLHVCISSPPCSQSQFEPFLQVLSMRDFRGSRRPRGEAFAEAVDDEAMTAAVDREATLVSLRFSCARARVL